MSVRVIPRQDQDRVARGFIDITARRSPFVLFLPFLLLFILFVVRFHSDEMRGDETRYYEFARNITHGFYSPPAPNINLWSGPGYPLFLVPFVYFKLPLIAITLCNAVFQYLSIVLLYSSLRRYVPARSALIASLFWAVYYISYQEMPEVLAETFTLFLCSTFMHFFTKAVSTRGRRYTALAGLAFGVLALTKIIFGFVLLFMILVALYRSARRHQHARAILVVFFVAFAVNAPYLAYTYDLTGRLFYWGNSGGSQLYWMSSPYEGEFGDWNNSHFDANCPGGSTMPCHADLLAKTHQAEIASILALPVIQQDDAYRRIALKNIRDKPLKYVRNWTANLGRMFFGFPASYVLQREQTLWRLPLNCVLLSVMLLSLCLTLVNWRCLPTEVQHLFAVLTCYLGLNSLVAAYPRNLYVVVPLILLWCCYIIQNTVTVTCRMGAGGNPIIQNT